MKTKLIMKLQLFSEGGEPQPDISIADLQKQIADDREKYNTEIQKLINLNKELLDRPQQIKQDKPKEEIDTFENEVIEHVGESFYKTLTNKEKDMLKTILKGDD